MTVRVGEGKQPALLQRLLDRVQMPRDVPAWLMASISRYTVRGDTSNIAASSSAPTRRFSSRIMIMLTSRSTFMMPSPSQNFLIQIIDCCHEAVNNLR